MIAAALLLAAQATAAPPASRQSDITVTARREKRRVSGVIRSLLTEPDGRQLARFDTAICPGIVGGRAEFAEVVLRLVRANMVAAGAKLAPEGCKVSALVAFTPEPRDLVASIFDGRWGISRFMDRFHRERLLKGDDAIRSFQLTRLQSANGGPVDADIIGPPIIRNAIPSRIVPATRQDAYFAMAIFDTARVKGKTVRQLADIATLHLLLGVAPDAGEKAEDSILAIFTRDPAPAEMTAFDLGMLKGLYSAPTNAHHGYAQRGRMAIAMKEEQAAAAMNGIEP